MDNGRTNCTLDSQFGLAPYSSSVVAMSIWFFLAAIWSGVYPFFGKKKNETNHLYIYTLRNYKLIYLLQQKSFISH